MFAHFFDFRPREDALQEVWERPISSQMPNSGTRLSRRVLNRAVTPARNRCRRK